MDIIQQFVQQRSTMVALIGGAVLGLLLGLAIGWWWWPAEWTNSTPGNLRSDFQSDYVLWVAERYATTGDLEEVRSKLGAEYWKEGQLTETLERLAQEQGGEEATRLRALAQALEETPPAAPTVSFWERLRPVAMVCGVGLLVVAFVGGAFLLVNRSRKPRVVSGGFDVFKQGLEDVPGIPHHRDVDRDADRDAPGKPVGDSPEVMQEKLPQVVYLLSSFP